MSRRAAKLLHDIAQVDLVVAANHHRRRQTTMNRDCSLIGIDDDNREHTADQIFFDLCANITGTVIRGDDLDGHVWRADPESPQSAAGHPFAPNEGDIRRTYGVRVGAQRESDLRHYLAEMP
jgi:hypothetical protein